MAGMGTAGMVTSTMELRSYCPTAVDEDFWGNGAEVRLVCTSDSSIVIPAFYVKSRNVDGNFTSWVCADGMSKTDVIVEFADNDFKDGKISARAVLTTACEAAGFSGHRYTSSAAAGFIDMIDDIKRESVEGKTARDIINSFAAAFTDMSDGVCYTFAAGESDTEPAYYLRIYQDGETGVDMSAGGWWRYKYTSHLCYDLYDVDGNLLSSNKLGYWYCKTWFIRYQNIYGYDWVSSVKITGDRWTVTRTQIPVNSNGETRPEDTVTETGRLSIPGNSVVLSTSSSLPF